MVNDPMEMKPYFIPGGDSAAASHSAVAQSDTYGNPPSPLKSAQPIPVPRRFSYSATLVAPVSDKLLDFTTNLVQKYPKLKPLEPLLGVVSAYILRLRKREDWIQQSEGFKAIERATKIPPLGTAALISVVGLYLFKIWWKRQARWITNALGVLYPALASLRAVEHPQTDDDERWLTYWSLFGLSTLADDAASSRIPYYYSLKASLLYWLFGKNGSLTVYRQIIRPYLPLFDSIPSLEDDTRGDLSK